MTTSRENAAHKNGTLNEHVLKSFRERQTSSIKTQAKYKEDAQFFHKIFKINIKLPCN